MTENKPVIPKKIQSPTFWLLLVLAVGLISRLIILLLYQPVAFSDSPSYRRLANSVLQGFEKYDGTRTPGYPVFLALTGNDQCVWVVQLLLGLATTLLLFYIGWKLTERPWFGGLIALSHTFNLGQLFFESNLLTETLTTFLLVLTMSGMLIWLLYPKRRSLWFAFFIGLISVLTVLVRPLFIYLPFFLLIFMWIGLKLKYIPAGSIYVIDSKISKQQPSVDLHSLKFLIAFIVPVVLLLGGWVSFIYKNYGDWSLTTMSGYHLIQHTGSFFEYVPDEYASLRDTYIHYRDIHITQYGTQTNTIWEAIPEMSRVSGYNFYDLSKVLTRISIQLILSHPFLFMKSAFFGWWMFWRTSFYWSADALRYSWMASGLSFVILVERIFLFIVNLIFIGSSIYFALSETLASIRHKSSRIRLHPVNPGKYTYSWLLLGMIWIASILQTILDHGDNPRFLVPMQSLVVLWVAFFFYQLLFNKVAYINSMPESA